MKSPDLILVDGSSYLFRAFHALPPLVNSRGQATGAVKGVINMIRSLIKSNPDTHIAIVFDAKGKTFRNDIYGDYKAHRPPMPDELRSQIQPIHEIIRAMGLPLLIIEGVEADDVIGTLARRATERGINTLVSTSDKDLAQLVNKHVTLMNTMTNEELDIAGVEKKFGIKATQIIDYLALMGDKSDNIPGVPGVGPKTAVKWLLEYQTIDGVIENSGDIGGKIGERLRENIEQARLSYELATIKQDVDLDIDIEKLNQKDEDKQALHDIFSDLEFKTWINELEQQGVSGSGTVAAPADSDQAALDDTTILPASINYRAITSEQELAELQSQLEQSKEFAFNIELEPAHFLDAKILGVSLCMEAGQACYIPLGHEYEKVAPQLPLDRVMAALKPALENPEQLKRAYDLKLLAHVLQNYDISLRPFKSDVLLASYVSNSVAVKHQLHEVARLYLDIISADLEKLTGKGRSKLSLREIKIDNFTQYAAERADLVFRLSHHLEKEMAANGHLSGVYRLYELPLAEVLQKMERHGIRVDKKVLQKQSKELAKQLDKIQQQVYDLAGEEFNLGSPKQLQSILFEKLQLPVSTKTKTGQASTAEPVLQELAQDYEIPRLILEQRSLSKLKSTYTDKLPLDVHEKTGRIHSTFQQAVAATGRLSST
ncbi:MAG: DNA polymerase, partial [Gammaproteobacteria bacterium]